MLSAVKRLTEAIRVSAGDEPSLIEAFAARPTRVPDLASVHEEDDGKPATKQPHREGERQQIDVTDQQARWP